MTPSRQLFHQRRVSATAPHHLPPDPPARPDCRICNWPFDEGYCGHCDGYFEQPDDDEREAMTKRPDGWWLEGHDKIAAQDRARKPLDTTYHDRYLRRQKRNPWFRFWFWRETRKLTKGQR